MRKNLLFVCRRLGVFVGQEADQSEAHVDLIMSETQAVRDIMHHVSGFHLVLNRDAFRNLLKESFHCGCFGSGNSDLYWTLLDEDRFVRTPRVVLINEATKHLEEEGWQEYSRWLATCLGASNTATNAQTDVEDDSALLDISLAGAEVKLIIWDDKTMVFKVELEGRWSADEADKINGFWGNGFLADEIPCVERNPFITAGTLREDVDAEAAGEDLLWRWMNPPPPPPDPQPEEEEIDELMNIYDDVSISLAGTWAQRQKKQVGKIFCDLLDNPVLLPGVIRPILEPDLHNPVCQRVNRELFFR